MVNAHDVTAAIVRQLGPVDPMRLNKLLYFAQAASFTWRGEPMFRERVEAWRRGPMVRPVYQTYRDLGDQPITEARGGDPGQLDAHGRHILAAVLDLYGHLTGPELSEITHADEAWQEAWRNRRDEDRGSEPISPEAMIKSFNVNPRAPRSERRLGSDDQKVDPETLAALFESV